MSLEEEIFDRHTPIFPSLKEYGFSLEGDIYAYQKEFMDGFLARIEIRENPYSIKGRVIELSLGEEYANFRLKSKKGSFAYEVGEAYESLLKDIRDKCFMGNEPSSLLLKRMEDALKEDYGEEADYPFEEKTNRVYRNKKNSKWYGIAMEVDRSHLGMEKEGIASIINIKLDPKKIEDLLKKKGYLPAYHMNKVHWISIVLEGDVPFEEVYSLLKESRSLTESKKKNPSK